MKEFAEGDCGVRVDLIVWGEEEGLGEELGRGFEGGEYCDCLLFCEEVRTLSRSETAIDARNVISKF